MLDALHDHRSLKINNWQDGCPGSEDIFADREQALNCSTGFDGSVELDDRRAINNFSLFQQMELQRKGLLSFWLFSYIPDAE